MPTIRVNLEPGLVQFIKHVKDSPDDTGWRNVPSHYAVTFHITAQVEGEEHGSQAAFDWTEVVLSETDDAPYRSIEDQAARQIPEALRAVADQIEALLADFEKRQRAKLKYH